jgi:hypothetical protein
MRNFFKWLFSRGLKITNGNTRIYFAPQPWPDEHKFEIYIDGERTGRMVVEATIERMLSKQQFSQFRKGDLVFFVPEQAIHVYAPKRTKRHTLSHWKDREIE